MKRSPDVGDNKAIVKAIAATKLNTVVGRIEWDGEKLPPFAAEEYRQDAARRRPVAAASDGNKYDIVITDNKTAPEIPVGGTYGADRLRQVRLNLRVADVRPG